MSPRWKVVVAALVVLLAITVAVFQPPSQWLAEFVDWIRRAGAAGVFVFAAAYVAGVVVLVPGSVLTMAAGFVYGVVYGVLIVVPSSVLGATLAFLLGRTVLRTRVERWVGADRRYRAVDQPIGDRGFRIVLLTRLSPLVPFNVLNYALGLTTVKTGPYMLASHLGMLPGTMMNVYLGSLVADLTSLSPAARSGAAHQVMTAVGLAASVALVLYVSRVARRALGEALAERSEPGPA